MKNLLFLFGILCMLASCKKNNVEPVPSKSSNDSVNLLPTFVYKSHTAYQPKPVYRFSYYPDGLLKKIIQYDSLYNPDQKDSTLYTYNSNNKVVETLEYSGGTLKYKTEMTYTNTENIETVSVYNNAYPQYSITYKYIYAAINDVAYVLKFDAANNITDSIVVDDYVVTPYYKPVPEIVIPTVDGYASYTPTHCIQTPNGVFAALATKDPDNPDADQWGNVFNKDNSQGPVFLNKKIKFQYEVAEKFIFMGVFAGNYPGKFFYTTPPGPRQYYISASDTYNTSGYGTQYTFDQDDRLIQSTERADYYTRSGSPIPGYNTIIIRYE